jgi:hypothetical protein
MMSNMTLNILISSLSRLVAIAFSAPVFIIPGLFIGICGGLMGQIYMKAQMSVKRERSNAKSPVVAEVNGAFTGLVSIRAFGVQQMFTQQGMNKINKYTELSVLFYKYVCLCGLLCLQTINRLIASTGGSAFVSSFSAARSRAVLRFTSYMGLEVLTVLHPRSASNCPWQASTQFFSEEQSADIGYSWVQRNDSLHRPLPQPARG